MSERQPTDTKGLGLARAALIAGLALMAMGQSVLFAIFGPLGRDIGMSEVMVGGVISLAAIAVVLASPAWGRQVDRRGRRPVFLISMAGLAITTLLFTLALEAGRAGWIAGLGAFVVLALARIAYGLAVTGAQPSVAGWVADTTTPEERTGGMAMIGAAYGTGTILGPVLAWSLSGIGLLVPLYTVAGMALCVFVVAWRVVPETRAGGAGSGPPLSPLDPRLRIILITLVVAFVVVAMQQQTLAFYVQDTAGTDNAQTAARVGQALALLAAMMFLVQGAVAVKKPAPMLLLRLGLPIGALGCAILILWPAQPGILLAHALFGLGFGLIVPGLQGLASLAVGAEEQGAVGGLVGASMAAGYAVGPVLGTGLYALWPILPYLLGIVLLTTFCAIHLRRSDPTPEHEPAE